MTIYKSWMVRTREAWYQLSQEEQESLLKKVDEARTQAGGKLMIACQSGWSNEKWHFFGIDEYPNIEAVQMHRELLDAVDLSRYLDSETMLGTEME
jgi:hypothetical protein